MKNRSGSDVGLGRCLQRLLWQLLIGACCGGFGGGGGGDGGDISLGVVMGRRRRRWRQLLEFEDGLCDVG